MRSKQVASERRSGLSRPVLDSKGLKRDKPGMA